MADSFADIKPDRERKRTTTLTVVSIPDEDDQSEDSISATARCLQPKAKPPLPSTSNDEQVSSPCKRKIDVANSEEEGSSAKESHQSNQSYDALGMEWSSFTRSIKKVTGHLYENHESWQKQPNVIEFCLKQVEDEIGTINGLLAGFAQQVERLHTFVLSRPLPSNELLVRGLTLYNPFQLVASSTLWSKCKKIRQSA